MKTKTYREQEAILSAPGWIFNNEGLEKEFTFSDFKEAFAFMTRIALMAEANDHHPEWSNVYNKVTVRWSTHSAGGVTDKDIEMIRKINQFQF